MQEIGFITEDRGAPKSAWPAAIATFATIVNPALHLSMVNHGANLPSCSISNKLLVDTTNCS